MSSDEASQSTDSGGRLYEVSGGYQATDVETAIPYQSSSATATSLPTHNSLLIIVAFSIGVLIGTGVVLALGVALGGPVGIVLLFFILATRQQWRRIFKVFRLARDPINAFMQTWSLRAGHIESNFISKAYDWLKSVKNIKEYGNKSKDSTNDSHDGGGYLESATLASLVNVLGEEGHEVDEAAEQQEVDEAAEHQEVDDAALYTQAVLLPVIPFVIWPFISLLRPVDDSGFRYFSIMLFCSILDADFLHLRRTFVDWYIFFIFYIHCFCGSALSDPLIDIHGILRSSPTWVVSIALFLFLGNVYLYLALILQACRTTILAMADRLAKWYHRGRPSQDSDWTVKIGYRIAGLLILQRSILIRYAGIGSMGFVLFLHSWLTDLQNDEERRKEWPGRPLFMDALPVQLEYFALMMVVWTRSRAIFNSPRYKRWVDFSFLISTMLFQLTQVIELTPRARMHDDWSDGVFVSKPGSRTPLNLVWNVCLADGRDETQCPSLPGVLRYGGRSLPETVVCSTSPQLSAVSQMHVECWAGREHMEFLVTNTAPLANLFRKLPLLRFLFTTPVWKWAALGTIIYTVCQMARKETRDDMEMVLRPRVAPGMHRIEWTCACGDQLYEDFAGLSEQQLDDIRDLVVHAAGSQRNRVYPQMNPISTPPMASTSTSRATASTLQNLPPPPLSSSTHHPITAARTRSITQDRDGRYLFLSLQVAPHHNEFAQVDVTSAVQDHNFFENAKTAYNKLRGNWLKRTLKTPRSISYIKFELFRHRRGYNAGHLSQEIPPETEVLAKRYHYDPCPLNPPLPSSIFLHALRHPEYYAGNRLQDRTPKKLKDGIAGALGSAFSPIGWGVHIHEGPHKFAIAIYVGLTLLTSLLAATSWTALKKDVQGGMGIGQYVVAVLTAVFGLGVFGWSYE